MSVYEDKLKKIADLKKSAEIERRSEIVRIMEKYTGKIKDMAAFEVAIKPCASAIKEHQQQAKKGKSKKKADTAGTENA